MSGISDPWFFLLMGLIALGGPILVIWIGELLMRGNRQ